MSARGFQLLFCELAAENGVRATHFGRNWAFSFFHELGMWYRKAQSAKVRDTPLDGLDRKERALVGVHPRGATRTRFHSGRNSTDCTLALTDRLGEDQRRQGQDQISWLRRKAGHHIDAGSFQGRRYRELRFTAVFLQKKRETCLFCCVNSAGSVAMLQHLVPEHIPLRKLGKCMFFLKECQRTRKKSRSTRCPIWSVSHSFLAQVDSLCTQQPAFDPKSDQIPAAAKVLRC